MLEKNKSQDNSGRETREKYFQGCDSLKALLQGKVSGFVIKSPCVSWMRPRWDADRHEECWQVADDISPVACLQLKWFFKYFKGLRSFPLTLMFMILSVILRFSKIKI